ncbi:molybdate ABC transporter ATP-binding protein ModF [Gilliamella sp. W8126]|uniref:molybdate ABC transporter ATP-binding protein ModF n=1 Tax=unclassified Gilliamella TaxID=2685620 RepID=UPI0018DBF716|nr:MULTISPECIES: molybdate ABC transporter ATP-binding protein ModF [unclassified Gilliamella]MBI0005888.1 molybdate ABC transporter ATP-binding protein ModF [Gilliamella sp. W8126]MBI0036984.1 molybdate ABC transporter ATP-binding protein ModF [Gilliamella sp. B14384G10]MBI0039362.1 molybdate ABC transporter ATP-binding protein ModF [Gilliamella sp. B14384G7]MBI0050979.1 molybdate ABC transporter ATP-binding protein ModF [Gilliamella sp. B14384G13]MBI0053271.1 molybdate ABC transporter ATP-bi
MLQIENTIYKISDFRVFTIESLMINAGDIVAFVGRNGSGKSILAKALAGDQTILSGKVINRFKSIAHISFEYLQKIIDDEWKRNNTDMLSDKEDDTGLTTSEIIQEYNQDQTLCENLALQFGIAHLLNRRFKYLSTGETRKTLICRTLMSKPELLILDEPFDGLDVASRANLAEILSQLSKQNITIVMVLNRFNEIPLFVKYIGLLANCQLLKYGTKDTILDDVAVKQLANLEHLSNFTLPDPDEISVPLPNDLDRIILNNGFVQYDGKAIINGLSWQVRANENWQIIGPNGAGKSTLLSLITGDHPQGYSNDLTLFGRKRGSGETIWDIKRHIGYVSSSFHLDYRISLSVENVLASGYFDSIGLYQAPSDKQLKLVKQWLQLLDLTELAEKPFQSLSWGLQRLVLIARALVKHPTLLILDEPLQGLDYLNRELVKSWIDNLIDRGNTQLLFVSHHTEDAPKCITHRLTFVPNEPVGYQYKIESMK